MSKARFLARPTKAQANWADMELGLFIHWFPMGWYQDIDESRVLEEAYQQELLARCTCETLDTDQWAQSAKDLGAKYLVFVAKHALGFCAWQTEHGSFGMKQIPYKDGKGDVVQELAASCKKFGIKLGLYLSADTMVMRVAQAGIAKDPAFQAEYNRVYRAWLTELLSNYGEVVEVWFDGSLEIEVGDILKRHAPNAMVFQSRYATIRWVGQEEGYASDPAWNSVGRYDALTGVATQRHGDPDGEAWLPLECDARIRRDWGFHYELENNPLKSLDQLMDMYYGSVGRGAVLLLNQAPHPQGHILDEDMARMKELGDEIRARFAHPLKETSGKGKAHTLSFDREQAVDHGVLMEDITRGERVRGYKVEGLQNGEWLPLCAGSAIGHKKIEWFEAKSVTALKLTITQHVGKPRVRGFAAFHAGVTPRRRMQTAGGQVVVGEFGTALYDLFDFTARLRFPIGAHLHDAGQYRLTLRLEPGSGDPLRIQDAWLEVDGQRLDRYCEKESDTSYLLFIPGTNTRVVFCATSAYERTPFLRGDAVLERIS